MLQEQEVERQKHVVLDIAHGVGALWVKRYEQTEEN
jgi:hypothetical protein